MNDLNIKNDAKFLKNYYGEDFYHLCRSLFPTILEQEKGLLSKIVYKCFAPTKSLYVTLVENDQIEDFRVFINLIYNTEFKKDRILGASNLTAVELMDQAGYILYPECTTYEQINQFKHYYAPYEELCTFSQPRLSSARVWFAVKKDVDEIVRNDPRFNIPHRQDKYGTSVISIQFARSDNSLSIKNRYNHAVKQPDATFSNNLDNIIPGLTKAFCIDYGIVQPQTLSSFTLPGFTYAKDNRYYHFNCCNGLQYFCDNNIIIENGVPNQYNSDNVIFADNYIIDFKEKRISTFMEYKNGWKENDSFIKTFNAGIKNIRVAYVKEVCPKKDEENNNKNKITKDKKVLYFTMQDGNEITLTLSTNNEITGYSNPKITEIDDNFLSSNKKISNISIPNVKKIGDYFLERNSCLKEFDAPLLKEVGDGFIQGNTDIKSFNAPLLEEVGDEFLYSNRSLRTINLPNIEYIGANFLSDNNLIESFTANNLLEIGQQFMSSNCVISELNLPEVVKIYGGFLYNNERLEKISLPSVISVGSSFISGNEQITEVYMPNLKRVGDGFLSKNFLLESLELPRLTKTGERFLYHNRCLNKISVPNLLEVGKQFLCGNKGLKSFYAPQIQEVDNMFLHDNNALKNIDLSSVQIIGSGFLRNNSSLKKLSLPNAKIISDNFMSDNSSLEKIELPALKRIGKNYLTNNHKFNHAFDQFLPEQERTKESVKTAEIQEDLVDDLIDEDFFEETEM